MHNIITKRLLYKFIITLSIGLVTLFNTIPVSAVSDFFSDSDIQLYDPTACDPSNKSVTPPGDAGIQPPDGLTGDSDAEKAFNFFISGDRGLSKEGAAGIVGNLMRETGGDDYALNPRSSSSGYHGIFQWDAGRWAKIVKWANDNSQSPYKLSAQLNGGWEEMKSDYSSVIPKLKNANDPAKAARDFNTIFEGGADEDKRASNAQRAFNDFKNNSATTSTSSGSSGGGSIRGVDFKAGMAVDTDGIGPSHGDPYHQGQTSYADGKLNADETNYIALAPGWAANNGLNLGDIALVKYKDRTAFAVYGDNYKGDQIHGEGSFRLVKALGISNSVNVGADSGVTYTVYPGTHTQLSGSVDQAKIDEIGKQVSGNSATSPSGIDPTNTCCPTSSLNDAAPGTGSPTGVSFPNLDPGSMASAINKYIDKVNPDSKMKGLGETIVKTAQKSNINPFVIVGIAQMESGLSSPNDYNVSHGNNSFGRTASASQPHFNGARLWYKWSSVAASVDSDAPENQGSDSGDIASYIRNSGFYDKGLSSNSLKEIVYVYAPPSENNSAEYVRNVNNWVKSMAKMADGTSPDGIISEDSGSSDTCCITNDSPETGSTSDDSPSDWKQLYKTSLKSKINQLARGKITNPKILAIHYTEYDGEGATLVNDWVGNPNPGCGTGCGIQFNVGKDGTVYQYYPLNNMQKTYHVGNANGKAIGIEITGRDVNALVNNTAQFNSVVALSRYLCDYYKIPCGEPKGDITRTGISGAQGMLGHDEIPTDDHNDPDAEYGRDISRTDSSKHPYMIKLRTAMGFEPTPGSGGGGGSDPGTDTGSDGSSEGSAGCQDASAASVTPGEIPSGSSKELAQKLLDLKRSGKYSCDNAGDCTDLEKVVRGDSIAGSSGCTAQTLDPKLLATVIFLINSGHKIGTYALCGDHFKDSRSGVTGHSVGRGVDISTVDGKALSSSSSKSAALQVAKLLNTNADKLGVCQLIVDGVGNVQDSDFTKYLYYNIGGVKQKGSAAVSIYSGDLAAHRNHIHAGVCGEPIT